MAGIAGTRRRRASLILGALVVAAVGLAALLVVANDDDDDETGAGTVTTTSTTGSTSTSTASTTSSTTTTVLPTDAATAVWPWATSTTRFDDPVAAARSFAVDYVGFVDPLVGPYLQGDSRSGEVEVRAADRGPATTVFLRQLGDDRWWVLGAASSLRVDAPSALETVSSPLLVRGEGAAFEGTIELEVREDGRTAPIGTAIATGGATGPAPFEGTVEFDAAASAGALVARSSSAQDGRPWEVSVLRLRFSPEAVEVRDCEEGPMPPPAHDDDEMVVTAYFHCDADPEGPPVAFHRVVPRTTATLRSSLEQLLAGPTPAEAASGATSWFSAATAGLLEDVSVDDDGSATVDLLDEMRSVIPNASTSAGSAILLAELDATVFQFPSITSVRYRFDGDCEAFGEWLQMDCIEHPRVGPVGED